MRIQDWQRIVTTGSSNGNVIQSFAPSPDGMNIVTIHKFGSNPENNVINVFNPLNPQRDSKSSDSFGAGHGQMLIALGENDWLIDDGVAGRSRRIFINYNNASQSGSTTQQLFPQNGYKNATLTGTRGNHKDLVAVRCKTDANEEIIRIFRINGLLLTLVDEWEIETFPDENGWFQGLTIFNDHVYSLTGDNTLNGVNRLRKITLTGQVLQTIELEETISLAQKRGSKNEPECLAVIQNRLYYGLMMGNSGSNIKYLIDATRLT